MVAVALRTGEPLTRQPVRLAVDEARVEHLEPVGPSPWPLVFVGYLIGSLLAFSGATYLIVSLLRAVL